MGLTICLCSQGFQSSVASIRHSLLSHTWDWLFKDKKFSELNKDFTNILLRKSKKKKRGTKVRKKSKKKNAIPKGDKCYLNIVSK